MKRTRTLLAMLISAMLLSPLGHAAGTTAGGYADEAKCMGCHADAFSSYAKSPHSIAKNPRTPAATHGCQSCHGAGEAHAKSKGAKPMMKLGKNATAPVSERNAVCLSCHENQKMGKLGHWKGSTHEKRGNSCTDCHNPHGGNPKEIREKTQLETCTKCHLSMKADVNKRSHHPIKEGKIQCGDCHNPHGTMADKLVDADTINEKCLSCHAEMRAPVLWEHVAVTENCLNCHAPHGSNHERLLIAKDSELCQNCHMTGRHPGTPYVLNAGSTGNMYTAAATGGKATAPKWNYKSCRNCHSQIHGSNHPSGKYFMR